MYFPKNKIKTGLNSNGEFLVKSSSKVYYGPYFSTSKGKYYAGTTPNYANLVELIENKDPNAESGNLDSNQGEDPRFFPSNVSYTLQKNSLSPLPAQPPKYYKSQPTNEDYRQGEYIRYFAKKTNEYIYIEINQQTYNNLKAQDPTLLWTLYDCYYMIYSLSSNEVNRRLALQIERENQWYGFSSYLGLGT